LLEGTRVPATFSVSPLMPTKQNAITLLTADHRKVEDLFEKYESARTKKGDIAKQICLELTVHTITEEEIFYPACREAGVESDMMDEANVEHDGAKALIAELEIGSPGDEFYDAKVKVLSEEIKHHVKEEEQRGGIFAEARKADPLNSHPNLTLGCDPRAMVARQTEVQYGEN
jgi:hypothetical protein